MNILVTGGGGMLAQAIQNIFQGTGHICTFRNKQELDICDEAGVIDFFGGNRYDAIINCAAYTKVDAAETNAEAAYAVNETGAANLAMAACKYGLLLLHISTDAVYDGSKQGVYSEEDDCNPLSVYSKSKYAGERQVLKYHNYGAIIRTSWLYSSDAPNFVTAITRKARAEGALNVVCDQLGTPTYTYDLAKALLAMLSAGKIQNGAKMEVYHFSNEGAISWYDFAVNICRLQGIAATVSPIGAAEYPSKVHRPFHAIMSKNKIKGHFGIAVPYWLDSLEACLRSPLKTS